MTTMKTKTTFHVSVYLVGAGALLSGLSAQTFTSHRVTIPGGSNVLVTGINDSGELVANYTDTAGSSHCATISGGTINEIVDPNAVGTGPGKGTSCWGINNAGEVVGSYSAVVFGNGFLYSGGTFTDIIFPGATAGTSAFGLNNVGQIVGSYADNTGQFGFQYSASSGTYTKLQVPGATATLAVGVNDGGTVTFEWVNATFVYSGAYLAGGHYHLLNVTGATQSKARGINVHGAIVLNAQDSSGAWHGYVYAHGAFTQFDVANATNTYSFGINSLGQLVGGFNPSVKPTAELGFEGHL